MRISPKRHAVAVLRLMLGLGQKEFGALVNRAAPTIQSIELGKLPLSPKLAAEISHQTGVSLRWLMENNVDAPPVQEAFGLPYNLAVFENRRAELRHRTFGDKPEDELFIAWETWNMLAPVAAAAVSSAQAGKFSLFAYKMGAAVDVLRKEFGDSLPAWVDATRPSEDVAAQSFKEAVHGLLDEMFKRLEVITLARAGKAQSRSRAARGKSKTKSSPRQG